MYSAEDISWIDIDWFAADALGRVGQFATGGGVWPPSPAKEHRSENEAFLLMIEERAMVAKPVIAQNITQLRGLTAPDKYGASFTPVAARGLFAFDKIAANSGAVEYLCVAAPSDRFLTLADLSGVTHLEKVLVSLRDQTFEIGACIRIPS